MSILSDPELLKACTKLHGEGGDYLWEDRVNLPKYELNSSYEYSVCVKEYLEKNGRSRIPRTIISYFSSHLFRDLANFCSHRFSASDNTQEIEHWKF